MKTKQLNFNKTKFSLRSLLLASVGCVVFSGLTGTASAATVLTFLNDTGSPIPDGLIPQDYGDNVAAAVQAPYSYGLVGSGFTPNVSVSYTQPGDLSNFGTGYGDLPAAIYSSDPFTITFTAQAGFTVSLEGFDSAAFGADRTFDFTLSNGTQTFSQTGVSSPTNGRNSVSFIGQLAATGAEVTLTIAPQDFDAGFSNFQFSQVPEPSSVILIGLASIGMLGLLRLRKS